MVSGKGKEVAGGNSSGKRKFEDSDKTGPRRKRKNRGVLQFFDDAACEVDEDEGGIDSDFFDDFLEDEFKTQAQVINEPEKAHHLPFFPKEEELSGEELEEMLEERYRPGSSFVTYAEDVKMSRKLMEGIAVIPPSIEPTIWKVKCMVGRERHSAFCLMQKYVDLHSLGTKLQIISAFAIEHVKGFIYIEAEKQFDINEACKGLCTIYSSRVAPVPKNEVSHLFSVRSKYNEISVGTWARIKNGKYKGDLSQVVAVNDARKKATVKLIPRIDIQAMAEKFGGGLRSKKTATPAPRLISSTELEEFRPLIQYRRDRDTGQAFEVLDGNQLKEGYLYKKVSIDSLSFSGVTPSEDELLKFEPSKKEESDCQEWLTQLFGERKKKHVVRNEKGGGGKGEGSSSSGMASSFEVHDLVLFGRKDFGVVVGTEKDDYFKILKEGSEGPAVVTVELHQLKNGSFDKKFTALDHQKKIISINDTVRVLEGPLQGRQGIVKQIYRGIIFLHDENEQENSGYSCCKSQICEKIKLFDGSCKGKGGELGSTGFEDFSSSPKSPLSPKKGWQERENSSNFNREGNDGMFSVGQSLRIRVGPLKGYLCRVLAIRRSDITVKLDSQQKILTVKCEHLAEVRGKSSAVSFGDDAESGKPFDLLGTQDCSTDWMAGAGTSTEGDTWGAGALSAERSAWPAFPSSGVSLQPESSSANPLNSVDNDANRDVGGSAWESKVTSNQNSSWGSAVSDEKAVSNSEQTGGWGKGEGSWTKAAASTGFGSVASDNWGSAKFSSGDQAGPSKDAGDNWNAAKLNSSNDAAPCWGNKTEAGGNVSVVESKNQSGGWGSAGGNSAQSEVEAASGWMKAKTIGGGNAAGSSWNKQDGGSSWNKQTGGSSTSAPESRTGGWGNAAGSSLSKQDGGSSWNKQGGGSSWCNQAGGSWNKQTGGSSTSAPESQTGGWGNAAGSSLNKQDGGSSWNKQGGGSSWGNQAGGSWNKQTGGSSTSASESQTGGWGNASESCLNKQDRGSSWNKQGGGSSWGNQAGGSWNKQTGGSSTSAPESQTGGWGNASKSSLNKQDGGSSWGSQAGGSWNKQTGGSSTSAPESPTGGWGNASGSSLNKQDGGSSWNKQGGGSSWGNQAGGSSWNKQTGGSSWKKQTDMNKEDDSKERAGQIDSWGKPSVGNSGFGGWSNNRMGNKDETDPKENWEGTKSFDGGRGSGGRRGRGGRGGRDQFGRGRSFGQGQSSGWSEEGQEYHGKAEKWSSSDGGGWGSSGGNKDQPEAESGGWKKSASVEGGQSGSWGNTEKDGGATGWGTKEGWNSSTGSKAVRNSSTGIPENQTGGWGNAGSSWGKSLDIPGESTGKGTEEDSWEKAAEKQSSKDGSVGSKAAWNTSMAAAENQSGGWGNAGGSWSKKSDCSSWGKQAGGSSWTKQTDMSSEESKEGTDKKRSWGKMSGGDGGFGGWNKSGMGNNDTDQAEGWGRSKSFGGGYDSAGSRGDGSYRGGYRGRGGSDRGGFRGRGWSSGRNEEGQDSGNNVSTWSGGQGGGWGRERGFDGGEDDRSDSGGYGGRGGSDRGGFRGRGRSDRGGYRGRGGFDRGGFRGKGSERGGFGGRGGRRDQNSDWGSRNDSSEDKPSGWKKNDDGGGSWSQSGGGSGWSQSGGGGSWSQSGGGSGWSQSGGGGSWSQSGGGSGGWSQSGGGGGNGQSWNSGWKPSKGAVESRAADDQAGAGGWRGSGSAKDAGGSDAGGGWNSRASSWNKSTGGSFGSQSNVAAAADGGQSSGWNQPKEPRGASEDGGAADPWGKATASSWGKGKDGGSKGGW